jgi:hypothetical protein
VRRSTRVIAERTWNKIDIDGRFGKIVGLMFAYSAQNHYNVSPRRLVPASPFSRFLGKAFMKTSQYLCPHYSNAMRNTNDNDAIFLAFRCGLL